MAKDEARRLVSGGLARLRIVRHEFAQRPAARQWEAFAALPSFESLKELGPDVRRHANALHQIEESVEYAQAALDSQAWDAAIEDIDRIIDALASLESALGLHPYPPPRFSLPRARLRDTLNTLFFDRENRLKTLVPWRRLDVALRDLERARRRNDVDDLIQTIWTLRIHHLRKLYRVGPVHRDTRREIVRLFDEASEVADYALAALEERAFSSALLDVERLDATLRALRRILQRESTFDLPEPWTLRLPGRLATRTTMLREALPPGLERIKSQ